MMGLTWVEEAVLALVTLGVMALVYYAPAAFAGVVFWWGIHILALKTSRDEYDDH